MQHAPAECLCRQAPRAPRSRAIVTATPLIGRSRRTTFHFSLRERNSAADLYYIDAECTLPDQVEAALPAERPLPTVFTEHRVFLEREADRYAAPLRNAVR